MTDTTNPLINAAAQTLLSALKAAEQTGAWLKGQLPDVLHQLVLYQRAFDICWMGILAAYIALWWYVVRGWLKAVDYDVDDLEGYQQIVFIVGGFMMLGAVVAFLVVGSDLIEVTVAPKVWLMDYVKGMFSK